MITLLFVVFLSVETLQDSVLAIEQCISANFSVAVGTNKLGKAVFVSASSHIALWCKVSTTHLKNIED